MEKEFCDQRHKQIDKNFETFEKRLNNHGDRIDKLEQYKTKSETQIENLIEQIKSLVATMKLFIGALMTAMLGFFVWYIQSL